MSAHTPGPWHLFGQREDEMGCFIEAADGTTLARLDDETTPAEQLVPNGRLIAAAPTLLEVLEGCLVNCSFGDPGLEDRARAVIARARGTT